MTFTEAVERCKVRGYIARKSKPELTYGKNHQTPLDHRVPLEQQVATDWETYDPEGEETSIVG